MSDFEIDIIFMSNSHGVHFYFCSFCLIKLNGIIIHKSFSCVFPILKVRIHMGFRGGSLYPTAVFCHTHIHYEVKIQSPHKPETQEVKSLMNKYQNILYD